MYYNTIVSLIPFPLYLYHHLLHCQMTNGPGTTKVQIICYFYCLLFFPFYVHHIFFLPIFFSASGITSVKKNFTSYFVRETSKVLEWNETN